MLKSIGCAWPHLELFKLWNLQFKGRADGLLSRNRFIRHQIPRLLAEDIREVRKQFRRFLQTPEGRARLIQRRYLSDFLDNHAGFGEFKPGSVGAAYIEFMRTESLSAHDLTWHAEHNCKQYHDLDEDLQWFIARQRDIYDLLYVLTGYQRNPIGETALLVFMTGQGTSSVIKYLSILRFFNLRKTCKGNTGLIDVYSEAYQNGQRAAHIIGQDILNLLYEPLDEVRQQLNIQAPVDYYDAIEG